MTRFSPWMTRLPEVTDATLPTGVLRTVAVELLLMSPLGDRAIADPNTDFSGVVILLSQTDANPGSQGSWVQDPHGFATVSGERAFTSGDGPGPAGDRPSLSPRAMGRRERRA